MNDTRETRENRLQKIEDMMKELTKEVKNPTRIIESLKKVENSNKELHIKLGKMSEEYAKLVEKVSKQSEEINYLKAENLKMKADIKEFNEFISSMEREKRRAWLEITGIPVVENEVKEETIRKIHEKCDIPFKREDILDSYRKKVRNNNANLIIKYKEIGVRDNIQKKIRRIKLNSENLGFKQDMKQVYANDCLAPKANDLFWKVRKARIENKWKDAWVTNSRIFVKRSAEDEPIKIDNVNDLLILTK